jgi:DNA-binding HxlR family transcriptional regulator
MRACSPHVEYALTANGRAPAERLFGLFTWINENVDAFVTAQAAYDARLKSA